MSSCPMCAGVGMESCRQLFRSSNSQSLCAVVGLAKFSRPLSPVSPEMLSCVALRFDAPGEDSEECDAVVWQRNGFPV